VGSGNIGATNVFRTVGKGWGILTFALDLLKGFVPAMFFARLAGCPGTGMNLACGCAAIAGHNWSLFLGFKGGKGVATSAGVLFAVAPAAVLIGLAVWVVLLVATGYVAVASMGAALSIPVAAWLLPISTGHLLPTVLTVMGLLVIYTHRGNIARLLNGTEHQFHILRKPKP
jgi:glycerol-3-phosphate acyltransferase PlsY